MEKFRKNTRIKCIVLALGILLPVLVVAVFEPLLNGKFAEVTTEMVALRYIIFILFIVALALKVFFYVRILRNDEYAEKMMIYYKDERQIFIKQKVYIFEYKLLLFAGAVMMVVTSFISAAAFYTLVGVELFVLISSICVKAYYNKKY